MYGPLWNFGLTINSGPFSLGDPNPKWIISALMSFSANPTSESKVTYICMHYVKYAGGTFCQGSILLPSLIFRVGSANNCKICMNASPSVYGLGVCSYMFTLCSVGRSLSQHALLETLWKLVPHASRFVIALPFIQFFVMHLILSGSNIIWYTVIHFHFISLQCLIYVCWMSYNNV